MAMPSSAYGLIGLFVTASYLGLATMPELETSILWQLNTLMVNIMVTVAVGTRLIQRFSDSMARLAESEHELDERVRQRTAELLKTQNTLQAALHSERAMREEQRQFFAMVNHEFRTPLAVMDSAATELQTFPTHELAPQRERAAQIRRACRRLAVLVDNCLASERLDTAAFRLQLDWTPVHELLADAVQLAQWSPRHHLSLDVDPRIEEWECDPTLVRIALSNLVDNAVKYASDGEIAVSARIDAEGALRLSVCDGGPGLPPGDPEQLFERGQRGSHPARGFGLGLWAVRRIAELHGGAVRASPSAKGGSCFAIVLPARVVQQE
jgi:signal transduction histidine kinase